MALNPNDPLRDPIDPEVPFPDRARTARQLDSELQVDPELDEGRASGGRIVLYGLAILAVLGAIFYGLNGSSTNTTASSPAPSTTAQSNTPAIVNPTPFNTAPGTTTGAAPRPAPPMSNTIPPAPANPSSGTQQ